MKERKGGVKERKGEGGEVVYRDLDPTKRSESVIREDETALE